MKYTEIITYLKDRIESIDKKNDDNFKTVNEKIDDNFKAVHTKIDSLMEFKWKIAGGALAISFVVTLVLQIIYVFSKSIFK
jgi:hypothetical protein